MDIKARTAGFSLATSGISREDAIAAINSISWDAKGQDGIGEDVKAEMVEGYNDACRRIAEVYGTEPKTIPHPEEEY